MDITTLFGRRLRALRKDRRLTQQQLGEKAKLSYKHVGAIERGEENPTLLAMDKLAKALGVEVVDLFEFEHEESSPATLRKKLDALLKTCGRTELQQAVKLLRAIVR